MTPFSIKIFVADGDPDGLRLVERSNWIGKAVMFPRTLLPAIRHREEFAKTGVYLLLGPQEDGEGQRLYVGEADPVRPRFDKHNAEKDFWTRAVFFVAGTGHLNKAHVQFLEAALVQRARAAKRVALDNTQTPAEPTLSEADRADMQVFLDHMLGMLPVLGIDAFEQPLLATQVAANPLLTCRVRSIQAQGREATQGFVVLKGSQAMLDTAPSMRTGAHGFFQLRARLIKDGVLSPNGGHYVFAQDYGFSSPSAAAAVVRGRSANGRTAWKDAQGRTLKMLQEAFGRESRAS